MEKNLLQEKEIMLRNEEEVKFVDLTSSIKADSVSALEELNLFKSELETKRDSILSRTSEIKEKVNKLDVIYPGLAQKSRIQDIFDTTTKDYMQLIEVTLKEVELFINICKKFCEPYKVKKEASEDSVYNFVQSELKSTKRYLKTRKKDLAVFFSRYDYGFKMHMSRLNMISNSTNANQAK